ncbi:AMP-dependent synthetase/ligase [Streptomyces marincola]|uniref:Long-chain fatty acid--CoA ligase n=1 Tax=Streptomyces marincola TaxID=2878388 RepID=A0A1W7CWX9_9ACTN|nr:AMP-dependent synthetase/ligase [Streptomyces marincola]ARQ69282.1 long-chain fatty acid--CoA ligase [Streptomyces marincola]
MSSGNVRADSPAPPLGRPRLGHEKGAVTSAFVPAMAPAVQQGSFADVPFVNAYEAPDAPAFSRRNRDGTWRDVTCAEFAADVVAVAKGLIAHGMRPGARLAIVSRTRYEWTLLDFAAWAAGLITVPVHPDAPPEQAAAILRDAGVSACAVEGGAEARTLAAIRHELPDLAHLWQLTALAANETSAIGQIAAAGRGLPDSVVAERRALLSPWLAATLAYTAGTTGEPKGCVLTHANLFAQVDNAVALLRPAFSSGPDEPSGALLFLPLAHALGRVAALACVRARVRLGHAPDEGTDDLRADLAGFRPTFLFAAPHVLGRVFVAGRAAAETSVRGGAFFERAARVARRYGAAAEAGKRGAAAGPGLGLRAARSLYDPLVYRRLREAFGGRLGHVVCGGAPLGRGLRVFFEGAGVSVHESYGLTEATAVATITPPGAPRAGTAGWPLPGLAVGIAPDGEVLVRGPQVFSGYWDGERRDVVRVAGAGGWFATGDVGALDADGYLTVAGRKADLLATTDGRRVAPGPVEAALRADPLVSQCVVVGEGRPFPAALVTLDPDGLARWAATVGRRPLPAGEAARDPEVLRYLQRLVDEVSEVSEVSEPGGAGEAGHVGGAGGRVSSGVPLGAFRVLARDFTVASGHLTPCGTVRRAAVLRDLADEVGRLYRPGPGPGGAAG